MTESVGNMRITNLGPREIAMRREFHAPPVSLFEAYTKPELLRRWLGVVGGWKLEVCEIDLCVSGSYRFVWRKRNGESMSLRGVYREILPPDRLVGVEVFDDPWYEGDVEVTLELDEHRDGRTTLTLINRYVSERVRDKVRESDMALGMSASFDLLAELMKEQQA